MCRGDSTCEVHQYPVEPQEYTVSFGRESTVAKNSCYIHSWFVLHDHPTVKPSASSPARSTFRIVQRRPISRVSPKLVHRSSRCSRTLFIVPAPIVHLLHQKDNKTPSLRSGSSPSRAHQPLRAAWEPPTLPKRSSLTPSRQEPTLPAAARMLASNPLRVSASCLTLSAPTSR